MKNVKMRNRIIAGVMVGALAFGAMATAIIYIISMF